MVGGFNTSEKYEFISWDDYSQYMDKKHVPNHQPEITRVIITYQIGCPEKKGELFVSYLRSPGATDQTSPGSKSWRQDQEW